MLRTEETNNERSVWHIDNNVGMNEISQGKEHSIPSEKIKGLKT